MGLLNATDYGDLVDVENFKRSVAGAELNVSIGLSRLGHTVEYVTKIGKDPIGESIVKYLTSENINTEHMLFSESHKTGLMLKSRVKQGDPAIAYYRSHSAFTTFSLEDVNQLEMDSVKLLHITGIPLAINTSVREALFSLVKKAKKAGVFITLDPNLRPSIWESEEQMVKVINEMASYADVILPGIAEGEILTGSSSIEDIAQFYLDLGVKVVITKSGEAGAYVSEINKETENVKGFKVEQVIDTVGAGDGFAAGIIHGYLSGYSWAKSAKYANAIGALQVQYVGDNQNLPTKDKLEAYIESFN
ncbi:2-dehydro-3-deoxygluconokinase [Halolactibacillus halophilus]|nr:2-dehydro-3-deoxygluconokinase [Halolactibacillus halophilus]